MQHPKGWTVVSKGPAMARKYSAKSVISLDTKNAAFPSEVKKVMVGCTPTNPNMWLDEQYGTMEGLNASIKDSLRGITKKRK